jgi:hypothetical protein
MEKMEHINTTILPVGNKMESAKVKDRDGMGGKYSN